jgi:alpha-D-ribose 1-methylphosphonate 5-triphosphate synthase subunit PhnI
MGSLTSNACTHDESVDDDCRLARGGTEERAGEVQYPNVEHYAVWVVVRRQYTAFTWQTKSKIDEGIMGDRMLSLGKATEQGYSVQHPIIGKPRHLYCSRKRTPEHLQQDMPMVMRMRN